MFGEFIGMAHEADAAEDKWREFVPEGADITLLEKIFETTGFGQAEIEKGVLESFVLSLTKGPPEKLERRRQAFEQYPLLYFYAHLSQTFLSSIDTGESAGAALQEYYSNINNSSFPISSQVIEKARLLQDLSAIKMRWIVDERAIKEYAPPFFEEARKLADNLATLSQLEGDFLPETQEAWRKSMATANAVATLSGQLNYTTEGLLRQSGLKGAIRPDKLNDLLNGAHGVMETYRLLDVIVCRILLPYFEKATSRFSHEDEELIRPLPLPGERQGLRPVTIFRAAAMNILCSKFALMTLAEIRELNRRWEESKDSIEASILRACATKKEAVHLVPQWETPLPEWTDSNTGLSIIPVTTLLDLFGSRDSIISKYPCLISHRHPVHIYNSGGLKLSVAEVDGYSYDNSIRIHSHTDMNGQPPLEEAVLALQQYQQAFANGHLQVKKVNREESGMEIDAPYGFPRSDAAYLQIRFDNMRPVLPGVGRRETLIEYVGGRDLGYLNGLFKRASSKYLEGRRRRAACASDGMNALRL